MDTITVYLEGTSSMKRPLILLLMLLPLGFIHAQSFGSNWSITYYNSTDLSGDVAATQTRDRLDTTFDDLPSGLDAVRFSLRAQTSETFEAGTYRFTLGSDDGARLFIDGALALDRFVNRSYTEDTVDVSIAAGTRSLTVEYFQDEGDRRLKLSWERIGDVNSGEPTEIPGTPVPTAIPVPPGQVGLGQVLNAEGLSVRSGPFLGASRLDIIEPGTEYPIFARNDAEGLFTWYRIQVQEFLVVTDDTTGAVIREPIGDPIIGWVSGRYFVPTDVTGDILTEGTVFETLTNPASTGVQGVLRSNMRLRQGPSYRTPTLQILDWGASVEIVGWTEQANQPHWYQVIYEGQVGWLFAPFIAVNGNLNTVPLY
jgi:hypothetical protein